MLPAGGARGKVRGSSTLLEYNLWEPRASVPIFAQIHLDVAIFH